MAVKQKTMFVCQSCGQESTRWLGKCPGCQSWNTFVEETSIVAPASAMNSPRGLVANSVGPVLLKDVTGGDEKRHYTGMGEFDRVLGGGIVVGSVTLIAGDPGIGESRIALQAACLLSSQGLKVL